MTCLFEFAGVTTRGAPPAAGTLLPVVVPPVVFVVAAVPLQVVPGLPRTGGLVVVLNAVPPLLIE